MINNYFKSNCYICNNCPHYKLFAFINNICPPKKMKHITTGPIEVDSPDKPIVLCLITCENINCDVRHTLPDTFTIQHAFQLHTSMKDMRPLLLSALPV